MKRFRKIKIKNICNRCSNPIKINVGNGVINIMRIKVINVNRFNIFNFFNLL